VVEEIRMKKTRSAQRDNDEHLGRAQYAAVQLRSAVRVYAVGFNPTAGYTNYFERARIDIWPPQFDFKSVPPEIGSDVITFFEVHTTFAAFEDVREVLVKDKDGEHHVPVARRAARGEGGDGPFPVFTTSS
jgi:hypothetical protein